ncbi:Rhodanese-like domain-containing protein 4, chloroplastic [Castilleja foliolosa]|uniref:Rhodanese-like domain-containing protein 4, chloroplastic n=1 Tax=Castilleja foliolosa TaxID=1961234 RepID=A0ABD3DJP1_9LAMI
MEGARISTCGKLGDDENAKFLDIRAPAEIKQIGGPDIRGMKKKAVAVVYKGEDKVEFLKKVSEVQGTGKDHIVHSG